MNQQETPNRAGHDAACYSRDQDHLNRWPLAREIYRISVDGPDNWSVRIGIYGEWGSGKSSVLNFIESMAEADGHVVFHFNPWQYQDEDKLWRSFVEGLFKVVETSLGKPVEGKGKRTGKKIGNTVAGAIPAFLSIWREDVGKAAEKGIGILNRFLTFSAEDLKNLHTALDGRRIIVAIDDLDRADGELVPEILYALKEIMDVPSMAFICAFDPLVVGKVLGKAHPGHDDGLKFLDKIIDYPRWLPEPTLDELTKMAHVESKSVCPFLPKEHIGEVVSLLPRNPRSVRQFIRIIALLKPQIERHHTWELQWTVILAANVLKVRFPKLAYIILRDNEFWKDINQATVLPQQKDKEKSDVLNNYLKTFTDLDDNQDKELRLCIESIVTRVDTWLGLDDKSLQYAFSIAESPDAVTWKEFDRFVSSIDLPSEATIVSWVEAHSLEVEEPKNRIYDELLSAAIQRRKKHLDQASNATTKLELKNQMNQADHCLQIISIISDILFKSDITSQQTHYANLISQFAEYYSWHNEPSYRRARISETKFIDRIFDMNSSNWKVWMSIIGLTNYYSDRGLDRPAWRKKEQKLREKLKERCAFWLIEQMIDQDIHGKLIFGDASFGYQYKALFFDTEGPVWKKFRSKLLKKLRVIDHTHQYHCYRLLSWLISSAKQGGEHEQARQILNDKEFTSSLWKQCVSSPLNPRMVGSLRGYQETLENEYQATCPVPKWWHQTCTELDRGRKQ